MIEKPLDSTEVSTKNISNVVSNIVNDHTPSSIKITYFLRKARPWIENKSNKKV